MISPGTEASGLSLPSTAISISRGFGTPRSISTRRSYCAASSRLSARSERERHFEQALKRAVFSVGSVQDGEIHVHIGQFFLFIAAQDVQSRPGWVRIQAGGEQGLGFALLKRRQPLLSGKPGALMRDTDFDHV